MKKILTFFERKYFCLFLSALLSALPLAFPSLFLLSWVSLIPFYLVILRSKEDKTYFHALGDGFFFGFFYHVFIYFWFLWLYPLDFAGFDSTASLFLVLFAWFGISAVHGFFYVFPTLLCHFVSKKSPSKTFLLFTAVVGLLIASYLPSVGELAFPWVKFSLGQYRAPLMIQSASVFGITGVDFLILSFSALLTLCLVSPRGKIKWGTLALSLAVFASNLLFGFLSLTREVNGEEIRVSLVQGNILSSEKFSGRDLTFVYTSLTEEIKDADLVLWSETAIPLDLSGNETLLEEFQTLSAKIDAPILLGCFWDKEGGSTNSAILITKDFVSEPYSKRHLVPFGEGLPYEEFLKKILPELERLNLSYNTILAGEDTAIFEIPQGKLGGIICFESLFPSLSRDSVKDGAEMIVLLTNDSWYKDSPAVYQHLGHAVFRSVESGRGTLRCAGSGVTAVINEKGQILEELGPLRRGVLEGEINFSATTTIYQKIGDVLLPGLCLIWLIFFAILIWKERRGSVVREGKSCDPRRGN